ncbi:MAG: EF2563 family selenium-dependent molybdenum hydroxylase system protein [Chloroflexi bacterium]|nr:EF2563 family selenium-dependent molybdenum hydroxylase system protein [Chloroflexota bacterium]
MQTLAAAPLVLIRGGGDLATGIAHRLRRAGLAVLVTELPQPLTVRRAVAFAEAVYEGEIEVEGITARRAPDLQAALICINVGEVAVLVDDVGLSLPRLQPPIVVDARMAKQPLDTRLTDAPLVIGIGPGFVAGENCHAVVETNRGHNLGRVYWQGCAETDTGQPEAVQGFTGQRVLRAPSDGLFIGHARIGDKIKAGEALASVAGQPIITTFDGVLRGILHDGIPVTAGMKVGDLDPRGRPDYCFTISDKARAVGGGVLEAILAGVDKRRPQPGNSTTNSQGVSA